MKTDFYKVIIPANLIAILQEEGMWEDESFSPFFIKVDLVEGETEEGDVLYSFDFSPTDDEFNELNTLISEQDFDTDGYGWTEFLMKELEKMDPAIISDLDTDPESETCSIVTTSRSAFDNLLKYLTKIFSELIESV